MKENRYLGKEAIERAQRYLDEGGDVFAVLALTFAADLREEYRGEDGWDDFIGEQVDLAREEYTGEVTPADVDDAVDEVAAGFAKSQIDLLWEDFEECFTEGDSGAAQIAEIWERRAVR